MKKPLKMSVAARAELCAFPDDVRFRAAYALRMAEEGEVHPKAKVLQGFGGASVLEVVLDDDGDTYRVVYTVQFEEVTVLLHAFQKKSKRGRETPQSTMRLIEQRLKMAREAYGGGK